MATTQLDCPTIRKAEQDCPSASPRSPHAPKHTIPDVGGPTRLLAAIVTTSAGGTITGGDTTFYASPRGCFAIALADALELSPSRTTLVNPRQPLTFTAPATQWPLAGVTCVLRWRQGGLLGVFKQGVGRGNFLKPAP